MAHRMNITWGVCRATDGSPLRTVFCLDCREVFGRYLAGIDHMDVLEMAEAAHDCGQREVEAVQDNEQPTNTT